MAGEGAVLAQRIAALTPADARAALDAERTLASAEGYQSALADLAGDFAGITLAITARGGYVETDERPVAESFAAAIDRLLAKAREESEAKVAAQIPDLMDRMHDDEKVHIERARAEGRAEWRAEVLTVGLAAVEEGRLLAATMTPSDVMATIIAKAKADGAAEKQEACAQLADSIAVSYEGTDATLAMLARSIAARIRARGNPAKGGE
jgi:flagellar biosynthesis/type III secretory pathway protein FliH